MAKEYIEREVAKEELLSWARCIKHPEHLMTEDAMCVLDGIPAADVVEVVHGRWVPIKRKNIWGDETDLLECSACKKSDVDGKGITKRSDYCPNCGARMDGGD